MIVKYLYRYKRRDGGITVSLTEPVLEYTLEYRLIADEGKLLKRGDEFFTVIDVKSIDEFDEFMEVNNEQLQ